MDHTISEPAPTRPQAVPQGPDPTLNGHRPSGASARQLPAIYLNEDTRLRHLTSEALEALRLASQAEAHIFQRNGALVRVLHGVRPATVIIEPLDVDRLRHELERLADFYKPDGVNSRTREQVYRPAPPPLDLVRDVLAAGSWPVPEIVAVTRVPIVREDWSIVIRPGYDAASGLWYAPVGLDASALKLPDAPGQDDARAAAVVILDCLSDFPFDCDASRANAIALLLTMVLRPCIPGCVPLAVVDAPTPGSGKGLLLRVFWLIATGQEPATENLPENEEELRKKITAILIRGDTLILFDNVSQYITSDVLCAALTSGTWSDRVLGQSKSIAMPQRATWAATGNNLQVGRDMVRRIYRIRLDTGLEHPERRTGFRHPDLEQYATKHHADLLGALLTIWLAWNLADRPPAPVRPVLGGFQNWASLLADLLHFAGVPDFLRNREQDDEANDEALEWAEFLGTWHEVYADRPMLVSEIVEELRTETSRLHTALPTVFLESLKRDDLPKRLGNAFKRQAGIPRGDDRLRLTRSRFSRKDRARWRVLSGNGAPADPSDEVSAPVEPIAQDAEDRHQHSPEPAASPWEAGVKGASPPPDAAAPSQYLGHDLLARLPEVTRETTAAKRAVATYAHQGYPQVVLSVPGDAPLRCAGRVLFQRLAVLIDSRDGQRVTYAYALLAWMAEGMMGDPPAMLTEMPGTAEGGTRHGE